MNFASKGKTLGDHENLREYHARIQQLPGVKEFWADDVNCFKKRWKPWFTSPNEF